MAWRNVGPVVTLEPGATVSWQYWFGAKVDLGVQIAGPHTGSFAHPGALGTAVAFNQGKIVEGINQVIYVVSIKNISTSSQVRHNLEGGGVT
jgi:hypothetical protein